MLDEGKCGSLQWIYNEFILASCFTTGIQGDFSEEFIFRKQVTIYLLGDTAVEMQHQEVENVTGRSESKKAQ
jgi:hypothetical protein